MADFIFYIKNLYFEIPIDNIIIKRNARNVSGKFKGHFYLRDLSLILLEVKLRFNCLLIFLFGLAVCLTRMKNSTGKLDS